MKGPAYDYNDLLAIAKGQLLLEDEYCRKANNSLIFIDTEMYVMKVWCEFVFGKTHDYILNELATRKYDLYLLCYPDLPWSPDELREYPNLKHRTELFFIYLDNMVNQHVPWKVVKGQESERFLSAVDAVSRILS
jgi:nicotinamide riboside kinase